MNTKLTVKIKTTTARKAKRYARKSHTSVSGLIENYFQKLTDEQSGKEEITPLVKSLSGIIKPINKKEARKAYTDYLSEKYK